MKCEQNDEYENRQEEEIQDRAHVGRVSEVHISWLLRAVTAAGGRRRGAGGLRKKQEGREREGEQGGVGVVTEGGKRAKGRAMARKEAGKQDGARAGGVYEVCTRLSAPGVPCGPGSGVREG